jgi:glutamate-1-semialdehyde 2,1-aminomutase
LARQLIAEHAHELAAVIVEPVLGSMGMVAATTEFLEALRQATQDHDIVLIFDEVITFRLGEGGAQIAHGVTPDLTCMGKIIGGGLPIGALGGKRELMQLFSPERERPVMHASTFSGNALTMSAGLAAMRVYAQADADRINALGERLREGFNQTFAQAGLAAQMIGSGSLSNIHFTNDTPHDARGSIAAIVAAGHIPRLLHLGLLRHGVLSASRLMFCVSTAMTEREIELAITALNETLHELRPYIEQEKSELLVA